MSCAHCENLAERVAWLEGELGIQRDATVLDDLVARMPHAHARRQAAQTLLALYAAKGRLMTRLQIMEAVPPLMRDEDDRDEHIVAVWISRARDAIGRDGIGNVWGRGYRLTPIGVTKVAEMIAGAA